MMKYNALLFVLLMLVNMSTYFTNVYAKGVTDIAATYKPDLAYRSQFFNVAAYCNEDQIKNWNCGTACNMHPTFTTYHYIYDPLFEVVAYVGLDETNKQVVVAFRGSANLVNWLLDFSFWRITYTDHPCPGDCGVHFGFYVACDLLQDEIVKDVKTLMTEHKDYTLLVTGHSLGAAMATLSAIDLSFLLREMYNVPVDEIPMELYVMGSPRVGNEDFVKWAYDQLPSGKHFHITHHEDPVPRVPFEWLGFIHIPTEVYYPKYDNVTWTVQTDSVTAESDKGTNQFSFNIEAWPDHASYFGWTVDCDTKPVSSADMAKEIMLASPRFQQLFVDKNNTSEKKFYEIINKLLK